MTVLIAAVLLVVTLGIVGWIWLDFRRTALRRRVMVNLTDGKALSGLLWARKRGLVVLKDVTLHERGAEPTPVDGEVLVERHRVDFVQAL